jgi:gliding motility-associated-like protein
MKKSIFLLAFIIITTHLYSQFAPPVISTIADSQVCEGDKFTYSITATGCCTITYQWEVDFGNGNGFVTISNNSFYLGATTSSLSINYTNGRLVQGSYRCAVTMRATIFYSNTAYLYVRPLLNLPVSTTTGAVVCGSGSVNLSASGRIGRTFAVDGNFIWYNELGTPLGKTTSAITETITKSGITKFYVALNDGFCTGPRLQIDAISNPIPAPPTGNGASACGNSAVVNLMATSTLPTNGNFAWYSSTTSTAPLAITPAYSPTITTTTPYYLSVIANKCESSRTLILATINQTPPQPTTSPNPAIGCGTYIANFTATGTLPNVGAAKDGDFRWYDANNNPIIDPATNAIFSKATYSPTITASTSFFVSVKFGICEGPKAAAVATSNPYPGQVTSVIPGSGCGPSADVTLGATGAIAGVQQYTWYDDSGIIIPNETSPTFTKKSLTITSTYSVGLRQGNCDGQSKPVTATIITLPNLGIGNTITCLGTTATLTATGATDGQYKWYATQTATAPIANETNSKFAIPNLTANATYYVSIAIGNCESARLPVTATLKTGCTPPTIDSKPLATPIGGKITLDLVPLIKTSSVGLDINSIKIITKPSSGGVATITNGVLTIDYNGIKFSGFDNLIIEACDKSGSCAQESFKIEVAGDIIVYNALSPDGNGKNDFLRLEYIDVLSPKNTVSIYNRWGDEVFSISDYNNDTRKFAGLTTSGGQLPVGTYYYKIALLTTGETKAGFLEIKY